MATLKRKRGSGQAIRPITENSQKKPKELPKEIPSDSHDIDQEAESTNGDPDEVSIEEEEGLQKTPTSSKLPSASELRAINESLNLYKSNAFRLQLEALLSKIRPKQSHIPPLERTLQKIYTHFTSLPTIPATHPLEAQKALQTFGSKKTKARQSVAIPYPSPMPPQSTAWTVAFEPPAVINVVGSWLDELAVRKPDGALFGVDLVVEMPATLFQEKDYRNSRFFYKRAFYIACLAASLSQSFLNLEVHYDSIEGDVRRTCLLLRCQKDGSEHDFTKLQAAIRIIPVLPDTAPIPLHRLSPSQANIRGALVPTQPDGLPQDDQQLNLPTPLYNNTLALSYSRPSRVRVLGAHRQLGAAPSFGEALALLRVWANQRGFVAGAMSDLGGKSGAGTRDYCVRGFEGLGAWWACVLEVLISGEEPSNPGVKGKKGSNIKLVGKGLSSYQLFRAALDFFAKHDFENEPVFMRVVEHGHKYNLTEWKAHHDAIFVDASGTVNLLADVPISSLQLLRHDAKITLRLLDTDKDPFAAVFLTDLREPHARFDAVISIDLAAIRHKISLDHPSAQAATLQSLVTTLCKALGTRAHAVVPLQARSAPRTLDFAHPAPLSTLAIGIIYDPAHAMRLVDHGPPASTPEVDSFRAFWGAKAELRRFKDGRIVESCVWDEGVTSVEDREGVPARIVRYILNLHYGLAEEHVHILAGDYGSMVVQPAVRGRGPAGYRDALAAYEKLAKELKTLEDEGDVPLVLVTTKPCSSSLRYTSVFPPSPIPSSSVSPHLSTAYLPAFDIVLQLERSSQWPDDLRAIQKVKLALFESMARGLVRRNGASCRACVVLDDRANEIEDGCALEVVLDGWAFHAHIVHDREATLLQDLISSRSKPSVPPAERRAADRAIQIHRRRFVHAPAHHSAVLSMHHKFPAFAYTLRLVKRWFGVHWLSARVSEEAIELLCAQVYLSEDVPATGKRGFVRVMEHLKSWSGAVYVPMYEAVKGDKPAFEGEVEAGKGRWRLMTLKDPTGSVWVEGISVVVAARVRTLAKATIQCFEEGSPTFGALFNHPTVDYDFLIDLDPGIVSRYWQAIYASSSVWNPPGYVNHVTDSGHEPARVNFNPPELFFRDLQTIYGDIMELFYDAYGGTSIGGVWNPSVAGPESHAWKVFLGFTSLPIASDASQKGKPNVAFNKKGVLAEIERMGEGLITKMTLRK